MNSSLPAQRASQKRDDSSVSGRSPGGALARRVLPWIILLPIALAWIALQGERAGYYNIETGLALLTTSNILILAALLGYASRSLNRLQARVEEQALANAHDAAAIVESSTDAIIGKTLGSIVTSWNPGAEKLFGYTAQEMIGQSITRLIPEDRQTEEAEIISRIEQGERVEHYETVRLRKDSTPVHVSVSVSPIKNDAGKIIGAAKLARDITDKKNREQAEEQIAEQAAFLDKARDAIIARDLEGRILFWNKGAERMYGWPRQDVLGQNIADLIYPDPKKAVSFDLLKTNQPESSIEEQHVTRDGQPITVEARMTLIRDNIGSPKSVLTIITDITEKKVLLAQFMRAQRMESIGTLAGGIAHDLNNILAPIMMSLGNLRHLPDDPLLRDTLEVIELSARRGSEIVRQVLSFSRGMTGERVEIQPRHLLKDIRRIIGDTFPKDIRLQYFTPNELWTILGDSTQIYQVLLNLCVNARDAMPNGGLLTLNMANCTLDEQYVSMNVQAKPGRYVKISVMDTGTGMEPQVMDRIFEPFFTTKDVNKGTGLGLSTVLAIIKSHQGTINVTSELGKGTIFTVHLPAADACFRPGSESSHEYTSPQGKGETILVVEDEPHILKVTKQTLETNGYKVITATDGAVGVALYAQHMDEISLVLTDMMMPVLHGAPMLRALARINPGVKVIAASGQSPGGDNATLVPTEAKVFLMKPYTAEILLNAVRAVLDEA